MGQDDSGAPESGTRLTLKRPRLLIEEWLPAAAIGVECMRERSTGLNPPNARLHVWWARRPLVVSRAAVLGSLLPADFPRDVFERLLGFGRPSMELVALRRIMDTGVRLGGFGFPRAFKGVLRQEDLQAARNCASRIWGRQINLVDPMAGGGSIPMESARLGIPTLANEYNPVACVVLEATLGQSFGRGATLAEKTRRWGKELRSRFLARVGDFFPKSVFGGIARPNGYIFARTVPCPDTQYHTPLVPDWHLLKPKKGRPVVAEPLVNRARGTWTVQIREVGNMAGQLREPPRPTYSGGKGISLFTGNQIPADYIKAKAQAGQMKSALFSRIKADPAGKLSREKD
jgi:putative DNA methylase